VQLGMMVEIVKEYGNDIPLIIKKLKEMHVENDEKEKAQMIFSTVHRSKGMEYDAIQLVNDFIYEEKLEKVKNEGKEEISVSKLNEEINLLYVAITRTKNSIHIPQMLVPKDFPRCSQVHVMQDISAEEKKFREQFRSEKIRNQKPKYKKTVKYNEHSYDELKEKHLNSYKPWTTALDDELTIMHCEGVNLKDMAKHFGRTKTAIRRRISHLELEELYG
jgi:F-box protein, helicase, 18